MHTSIGFVSRIYGRREFYLDELSLDYHAFSLLLWVSRSNGARFRNSYFIQNLGLPLCIKEKHAQNSSQGNLVTLFRVGYVSAKHFKYTRVDHFYCEKLLIQGFGHLICENIPIRQ